MIDQEVVEIKLAGCADITYENLGPAPGRTSVTVRERTRSHKLKEFTRNPLATSSGHAFPICVWPIKKHVKLSNQLTYPANWNSIVGERL